MTLTFFRAPFAESQKAGEATVGRAIFWERDPIARAFAQHKTCADDQLGEMEGFRTRDVLGVADFLA